MPIDFLHMSYWYCDLAPFIIKMCYYFPLSKCFMHVTMSFNKFWMQFNSDINENTHSNTTAAVIALY